MSISQQLKKLGVNAALCIAFEDSRSGMLAAARANLKTVVVPHPKEYQQDFTESHLKLQSLDELDEKHLAVLMT
ncbi:MAG: hypothetical protein R3203_00065 [Pseudoalteromonas tetraodonis]|nr:hypothetical protein [Pseudoalteromonas tetraodonis]